MLWHKDSSIASHVDAVILPGGFSYGEYLRCGTIKDFARRGGPVVGICNGFQILTESGMLLGALVRNHNQH